MFTVLRVRWTPLSASTPFPDTIHTYLATFTLLGNFLFPVFAAWIEFPGTWNELKSGADQAI